MYGGTSAKILHAVLLGICEYIAEGAKSTFTASAMYMMSHIIVGIYEDSRRQSERDLPDLGLF